MQITFERSFADPRTAAAGRRRLARSGIVVVLFGAVAIWGTAGALASAHDPGFVRDRVSVATDGGRMFALPALAPGRTVTRYATVTTGDPRTALRLYATTSGTGLARFLTLIVTRGAGGPADFVTSRADLGMGPGVVFSGPLSDFPSAWPGGVRAPGGTQTFRFEIRLSKDADAEGRTASTDFRWEARAA